MTLRPLFYSAPNGGNAGRGNKIRTCDPCLPKTLILPLYGDFPWRLRAGQCRFVAPVRASFWQKVHSEPSTPVLARLTHSARGR